MSVTADQHFAIVPEWVLYADVSAQAIRTYAVLRRYADKQGKAHPSYKTLAEMGHCSVATVRRALDELIAAGAIDKRPNYVEGRQTSNDYVVISSRRVLTGEQDGVVTDEHVPLVTGEQGKNQSQKEPKPELTPSAPRKRDVLFDAIQVVCFGATPLTKAELARIGVATSDIRTAFTPEDADHAYAEVERRARNYVSRWPNAALTPMALSNNWSMIGESPAAVSEDPLDYYEAPPIDEARLAEFAAEAKANPWKSVSA